MKRTGSRFPVPGSRFAVPFILALAATIVTAQGQGRGGGARGAGSAAPSQPQAPRPLLLNALPVRACESLVSLALPNTTIDSSAVDQGTNTVPASCRIQATVTHPPAGDKVKIFIALPLADWNGRFEGTGGSGFSGGNAANLAQPLGQGFATAATDTGHDGASGSFALDTTGHLNWQLIRDNAYLGIHEMTTTSKALVQQFYGQPAARSYFNGCSTGGRQGLAEAQRYPADYDGILAGAPAINLTKLAADLMWATTVMLEAKHAVPACMYTLATNAAIAACDAADGVKDGIIDNPKSCTFDPKTLVGRSAGDCGTFTAADADIIAKIWQGPRRRDGGFLWYGVPRGADLTGLGRTSGTPLTPQPPGGIGLDWWRYLLNQNAQWDYMTLTRAAFEQYWDQSVEEFSAVFATDNPDLSAFRDHGGKLVLWHGWADPLIYPEGTIDYYGRLQQMMGGPERTALFARLFLAPGVGHCGGGPGMQPDGQLDALLQWVEAGVAPNTLMAVRRDPIGKVSASRPLCAYPLAAHYKGSGKTDDPAAFECKKP